MSLSLSDEMAAGLGDDEKGRFGDVHASPPPFPHSLPRPLYLPLSLSLSLPLTPSPSLAFSDTLSLSLAKGLLSWVKMTKSESVTCLRGLKSCSFARSRRMSGPPLIRDAGHDRPGHSSPAWDGHNINQLERRVTGLCTSGPDGGQRSQRGKGPVGGNSPETRKKMQALPQLI